MHSASGQWRRQQSEGQSGLPSTALDHVSATERSPMLPPRPWVSVDTSTDKTPPAGTLSPVVSNVRFANSTGAPNQLSDDLKLFVRHQSDATKTRLSFKDRTYLGATAGPMRAHKCALHFAAAWGHRGTLVGGELAARTSLRGDVEVAHHPATFPGFSTPPRRPRACLIFYSRVCYHTWSTPSGRVCPRALP